MEEYRLLSHKKKCFKLYIWCDYDIGENAIVSCSIMSESLQPMDCSSPGSQSMEFFRQEYWSGLPSLPPEDLPDPGIKPMSPAMQADSLPSEPSEKPWGKRDAKISEKKGNKKFPGGWNIFRIISKYFSDCGDTFSLLFRKLPFFFSCSIDYGILVPHSPGSGSMES